MTPNKEAIITEISLVASAILSYKPSIWERNSFTNYNFSELIQYHNTITALCSFLNKMQKEEYSVFSDNQLKFIAKPLGAILKQYENISNYNLDSRDFADKHHYIIRDYITIYEEIITHASQIVVVSILQKGYINNDLSKTLDEASRELSTINHHRKQTSEAYNAIHKNMIESNKMLDSLKIALDNIAIVKYNSIFEEESNKNRIASYWWLGTIGLLIASLIYFAFYIIHDKSFSTNTHSLIEVISTRVIIISSLFVGLSLSIKNYNAHRHNQTINKHRQNALNTFETFVKSAKGDTQIEQAILLEVTRTIFGNQATGFTSNEHDVDSTNRVVEIIKNISNVKQ